MLVGMLQASTYSWWKRDPVVGEKIYARAMIVVVVGADVWLASPVPRGVEFS